MVISYIVFFILNELYVFFYSFVFYFFFFFSSRRRHTRCLSDWSSDVCSSDLPEKPSAKSRGLFGVPSGGWERLVHCTRSIRSEERRVGKECRSRWSPYH